MKFFPAIILLLLLVAVPAIARGEETAGPGIFIKANSLAYDKEKDTYQAKGDVEIKWDGYTLYSDMASLHQGSGKADATGKVKLVKGNDVLTCDRLDVDLNTEKGEVVNGDLLVRQNNFHVRGAKVAKVGEKEYHLDDGVFTTCDGDEPSWKFTASDMDVDIEGNATGRHARFFVNDVPVFYFPYVTFPVNRERQSGFLVPRVGNSTKKGFTLDIPYYWAISPNQEATFDLDIQTKRGAGTGLDYRYLRPRDSKGDFRGYLIYDFQKNMTRGNLLVSQEETFSPTLNLKSNVNLVLDRDFYKDYGEIAGDYNRQLLDTTVALAWRRQTSLLNSEIRYINDLSAFNNRHTLQKLPTISFTTVGEKLGDTSFYAALDSNFTNFYRMEGQQGQRLELHPTLTYNASLPSGPDLSLKAGYLVRIYNAYGSALARGYHSDGLANAEATLSKTLYRVYDTDWWGMRRLRHAIVPEAAYTYIQEKGQDTLPFFDYNDRIVGGQFLSWSLTNYFTGKFNDADGEPLYRDLAWFKLSQGFELSGSRRNLLNLGDEGRHVTDIRMEARVTPVPGVTVNLDSYYNPNQTRFSSNNVAVDLTNGRGDNLALAYRFTRHEVDYLEGRIGLALVKPFLFKYTGRYSIDKGGFLESVVDLEYKQQCWSVVFTYRERPDNREFLINFNLAGIGSVGKIRAF
jgi:LPS-assembly protein